MRSGCFVKNIQFTDGMEMSELKVCGPGGNMVEFVTLDFGWHSLYMATHPLFFAERGTYLFVWNPLVELNLLDAAGEYLAAVCSRAPCTVNAPLVVVSTRADVCVCVCAL